MEEMSAQEAAGSPRVQFQSLETQSECLSPEPQFEQDTDMEQGFTGGFPISKPDGISQLEQDLQVFDLETKNREVLRDDCSDCVSSFVIVLHGCGWRPWLWSAGPGAVRPEQPRGDPEVQEDDPEPPTVPWRLPEPLEMRE